MLWTFDEVERQLMEAVRYWRRSGRRAVEWPNLGGPFATDAPWQLLTREVRASAGEMATMDLWRTIQEDDARLQRDLSTRPVPLTSEQVDWMDSRLAWLLLVQERDRKLVELVIVQLAWSRPKASEDNDGRRAVQVDWRDIRRHMPVEVGTKALYRRYSRAIASVAAALNGAKIAA